MEAIRFEKVSFSYEENEAADDLLFSSDARFSLDKIDLSVQEGEFVAILGHNGSGKSTLARLSNGLLTPTEGKITVMGMELSNEDKLFEIRKNVGIVFQNPDNQTVASIVEDDIAFGPENIGVEREEIGKRISFALDAVGMSEYRYSTTSRLSGGQKQRIAIAGVLALKPRVMILDESTAMLDPRGRKEVIKVVQKLNKEEGITVLLITHFPEEALLADRAVVMHKGKIVLEGKPKDILSKEKELASYSLTLPRTVKLCRELSANGLEIEETLFPEELADRLATALQEKNALTASPKALSARIATNDEGGKIECENLRYVYNERSPFATYALDGVSLEIRSGEFFGIIGHTGSGKSTFIQHLNALIKLPTAEKKYKPSKKTAQNPVVLRVAGFDLTQKTTDFKTLRKKVGMVFQYPEYQLFAETVFEDVAFGLKNFNEDLDEATIEREVREAIESVGLDYQKVKDCSPFDLSGGQKRRVAIAGVIVTKPEILVLDEPAAGLDPLGKEEIMSLLHTLHSSWCKTVIVVSHDMDEIAENCTRAAVFSGGKLLAIDEVKNLFLDNSLAEKAGLELPLIAKITERLHALGYAIDSDLTMRDFTQKTLALLQTDRAGTSLTRGGADNA